MMRDHHYASQELAPPWATKCDHCGRRIHYRGGRRFGSNACRQAAYRERLARYQLVPDRGPDRGPTRNGVAPLSVKRRRMAKGGAA